MLLMRSKTFSKSELRALNAQLEGLYSIAPFEKKEKLQLVEDAKVTYLRKGHDALFFFVDGIPIPTLKCLYLKNFLKTVTVDMGSVRFICSGANVMRPGITHIPDGIREGEVIAVQDEQNKKILVVGKALLDSSAMRASEKGKVILNLHSIGDVVWNLH